MQCDQGGCPARAAVAIATSAGPLFFCEHHARGHFGFTFDQTEMIVKYHLVVGVTRIPETEEVSA